MTPLISMGILTGVIVPVIGKTGIVVVKISFISIVTSFPGSGVNSLSTMAVVMKGFEVGV